MMNLSSDAKDCTVEEEPDRSRGRHREEDPLPALSEATKERYPCDQRFKTLQGSSLTSSQLSPGIFPLYIPCIAINLLNMQIWYHSPTREGTGPTWSAPDSLSTSLASHYTILCTPATLASLQFSNLEYSSLPLLPTTWKWILYRV